MLSRRIIPCLDVRAGQVVKGVRFRNHAIVGDILELADRYRNQGADELVFYDIAASTAGSRVETSWISRVARGLDIPFCVAGGIASVVAAREILMAGADKISVNSPALARPELIDELADAFGSQCVVVGIDSLRDPDGNWRVRQYSGDPQSTRALSISTMDWIDEVQQRGAGEIVLNCMANDGLREGFDLPQLIAARGRCRVPLIASGGAGEMRHFVDVFRSTDVDGALAASVFHDCSIGIPQLKHQLLQQGFPMRPCAPAEAVLPRSRRHEVNA